MDILYEEHKNLFKLCSIFLFQLFLYEYKLLRSPSFKKKIRACFRSDMQKQRRQNEKCICPQITNTWNSIDNVTVNNI